MKQQQQQQNNNNIETNSGFKITITRKNYKARRENEIQKMKTCIYGESRVKRIQIQPEFGHLPKMNGE